jgi:hypothetical protein
MTHRQKTHLFHRGDRVFDAFSPRRLSARFFIERGRAGIRQRRVMGAKRRAAERESRATSKI